MSAGNPASSTPTVKQGKGLGTIALVGIAYFLISVAALHFLRPDVNPLRQGIGDYALGPYGLLMTSAFLGLGLGSLALGIGLYQGVSPPGRSWLGLALLGVFGVGALIV